MLTNKVVWKLVLFWKKKKRSIIFLILKFSFPVAPSLSLSYPYSLHVWLTRNSMKLLWLIFVFLEEWFGYGSWDYFWIFLSNSSRWVCINTYQKILFLSFYNVFCISIHFHRLFLKCDWFLFFSKNDLAMEVETTFEFFAQTPPGGYV